MEVAGLANDWYNAFWEVNFELKVDPGTAGETTLTCATTAACRVRPNWNQTPLSYGLSPNVLYPGQKTTAMIDPRGVMDRQFSGTFLHMVDIKLDDTELNRNPFVDEEVTDQESLSWWTTNYIEGLVTNEIATTESSVVSWFHGAGNALILTDSVRICTADGEDCYETRIMPTITNIDHSSGYTTGGQEITIDGTSLNAAEPVVTIDGVECTVTEYSFYQLKCITGEKEAASAEGNFVGQHGIRNEKFDGDFYNDGWDNFENNIGYGIMDLMTTLEIASTQNNEYAYDRMTGYFKAPLTGEY